MRTIRYYFILLMGMVFAGAASLPAFASNDLAKTYKEVFGGDKPKCLACHVDKLPKKDDGKHDLNEYGKKLAAEKAESDAERLKKVGPAPAAAE